MSREVPLTLSEKIKLGFAILFILGIMFPMLRWGIKELYQYAIRDTEGYEKTMSEAAEYYKFKVVAYKSGLNSYNIEVDTSVWRAYDKEQRFAYCEKCQKSIYQVQQKHKMQEKDNQPVINFYVNGSPVAHATYEEVRLY